MTTAERLRELPSVEEVAQRLEPRMAGVPRRLLIGEIRRAVSMARQAIRESTGCVPDVDSAVLESIAALRAGSLQRVINATGVVLHTNLGRAPASVLPVLRGYSNLEFDIATGKRGKRDAHTAGLFDRLLGKPSIAVNNNAAAVYLVLNELAAGAEVIVSRGQLIEIGDGFRIPEIMQRAGVVLREVGTTNRTSLEDFRAAITERTRLLLIVHPSNFRIAGFTAQPARAELAALSKEAGIPLYEDAGSGCLVDLSPYGIEERLVQDSLRDGVNVVSFSGDKLLGGPQAGIIAGDAELVARIRRNPMFRAFRLDKLIIECLERHLRSLMLERLDEIPALRMIRTPAAEIRARAEAVLALLPGLRAEIREGESVIGGGSTPAQSLPTSLISIAAADPMAFEKTLRSHQPAVIARLEEDRVLIDLRTVFPEEEPQLIEALRAANAATAAGRAG